MYSQCPECLTRFRVTAAALRVAHGTVRCGRCGSAFDALQSLSDVLPDEVHKTALPEPPRTEMHDVQALAAAQGEAVPDDDGGPPVTEFHFSADDLEQVFVDVRDWQQQFGTSPAPEAQGDPDLAGLAADAEALAEVNTAASAVPLTPSVYVHEPEAVEDITLEGERVVIEGLSQLDDTLRIVIEDTGQDDAAGQYPVLDARLLDADLLDEDVLDDEALTRAAQAAAASQATGAGAPDAAVVEASRPDEPPALEEEATEPEPAQSLVVEPEQVPHNQTATPAPLAVQISRAAAPTPAVAAAVTPASSIAPFRLRDRAIAIEGLDDDAAPDVASERRTALLWSVGSLVLALALVAQLTHHFRQELARDSTLGPVVRSIYSSLGRPLAPNWDLAAFELRQWGANEVARAQPGSLTIRASLRNGADFAQPLPLLRLELDDRFGGTVARRDFEPGEYLENPAQATRLLGPGAAAEAELVVVDATPDGYRLDVCLRDDHQTVRCSQAPASDATPR
jgi:predicted Zn finger-like uncharacterized protein